MKEISLRKAKLDDFEMYKTLYEDDEAQFIYSNHDEDNDESYKNTLYNLGIDEKLLSKEDVEKDYKNNLKNIYFVYVNQVLSGYIKTEKKGKELIIRDMAIRDYSITNEVYLCKLFNILFKTSKTEKICIFFCNDTNAKMLQRIGFVRKGHLEKTVGI